MYISSLVQTAHISTRYVDVGQNHHTYLHSIQTSSFSSLCTSHTVSPVNSFQLLASNRLTSKGKQNWWIDKEGQRENILVGTEMTGV